MNCRLRILTVRRMEVKYNSSSGVRSINRETLRTMAVNASMTEIWGQKYDSPCIGSLAASRRIPLQRPTGADHPNKSREPPQWDQKIQGRKDKAPDRHLGE